MDTFIEQVTVRLGDFYGLTLRRDASKDQSAWEVTGKGLRHTNPLYTRLVRLPTNIDIEDAARALLRIAIDFEEEADFTQKNTDERIERLTKRLTGESS